ncbi:MAG: hypothetical protein AAF788_01225 [Pseudomonadota bacterium]
MTDLRALHLTFLEQCITAAKARNPSHLAEMINSPASTLTGFVSGRSKTLRSGTLNKLAALTGIAPPGALSQKPAAGFFESEAIPFAGRIPDMPVDPVGGQHFLMQMQARTLELSDIKPGDILVFRRDVEPVLETPVCVQRTDARHGTADTLIRLWKPPFLMTHSTQIDSPIMIDSDIIVMGVLEKSFRVQNWLIKQTDDNVKD